MVLSSWFLVLGFWFLVLGSWFLRGGGTNGDGIGREVEGEGAVAGEFLGEGGKAVGGEFFAELVEGLAEDVFVEGGMGFGKVGGTGKSGLLEGMEGRQGVCGVFCDAEEEGEFVEGKGNHRVAVDGKGGEKSVDGEVDGRGIDVGVEGMGTTRNEGGIGAGMGDVFFFEPIAHGDEGDIEEANGGVFGWMGGVV